MTTNHIDQLAQWYADAEQITKTNLPNKGDTLIYPRRTSGYIIEADGGGWIPELVHSTGETVRILARAPKPKPTWHDAPAVTAKGREDWDHVEAFSRNDDYDPPRWIDNQGITYTAEQLSDVTPLIEAKVTDETARTVLNRYYETETGHDWPEDTIALMRLAVTAALGLETE